VLPVLHGLSVLISLAMAIYMIARQPKAALNRTSAAVMLCVALWAFKYMFTYNPYASMKAVWLGELVGSFGWTLMLPLLLLFFIIFTENTARLRGKYLLAYLLSYALPACIIYQHTGGFFFEHVKESYGWGLLWPYSPLTYLFYIYMFIGMILCVNMITTYVKNEKRPFMVKRAQHLIFSTYFTFVVIFLFAVVLAYLGITFIPDLSNLIACFWGLSLLYGDMKYQFYSAPDVPVAVSA